MDGGGVGLYLVRIQIRTVKFELFGGIVECWRVNHIVSGMNKRVVILVLSHGRD